MKREEKHLWIKVMAAMIVLFLLWGLKTGQSMREASPEEDVPPEVTETGETAETEMEEELTDRVKVVPGYIKGLEYDDGMTMQGSGSYACWKDILILGDTVYKLEDKIYKRTEQSAYELFGLFPLENTEVYGKIRQYENLIITRKRNTFLICDLDKEPYFCYEYEPLPDEYEMTIAPSWNVYEGELFYRSEGKDGSISFWAYNLESRETERTDIWTETEISSEERGREDTKWLAFCGDILFFYDSDRKIYGNGGIFTQHTIGEPGETGIDQIDGTIFTEDGYFRYDGKENLLFYDLEGNERAVCQIREEGLGEAYFLRYLIYNARDRGRLYCFYENRENGQLHLNQMFVKLPEISQEEMGLSYWLKEGAGRISVTPGQEQGNILGYTFRRSSNRMEYVREPDWLVKNASVGKGIFRSEHMSETSVFLGEILRDTLKRQKISKANRQYFSQWAQGPLPVTKEEKQILRQGKKAESGRYECFYRLNRVFGLTGYDFFYRFYGENWEADVRVTVDSEGMIRDMGIDVDTLPEGLNTYYGRSQEEFFEEGYEESIIRNGEAESGKILIDFGKYWQQYMDYEELLKKISAGPGGLLTRDAAESGETIGRILTDVAESRGENGALYGELFQSGYDFYQFQELPWESLSEDWKSDGAYDCYMTDRTEEEGCIKLRYYLYPDFHGKEQDKKTAGKKEETAPEAAQAVILEVTVTDTGKLADTALQTMFLTEGERMAAKEKERNKLALIRDGEDTGAGVGIRFTDSMTEEVPVLLEEYRFDENAVHGNKKRNELQLWGCDGAGEIAAYVGEALLEDLNEKKIENGRIKELFAKEAGGEGQEAQTRREQEAQLSAIEATRAYAGSKWKGDKEYNCYIIGENERNGCLHFRYYFYRNKPFEGKLRIIAADVYLSERGIETIETRVIVSGEEWVENL